MTEMKFSYYPGCTLKNKAKDLDVCARAALEKLGVTLEEIDEWQCCGGCYTSAKDEIATKLAAVRALKAARDRGEELVTVCSACHNVLKRVNDDAKNSEYFRTRVTAYTGEEYAGETKVVHMLELLRDYIGFDKIASAAQNPVGKKVAAYYGCLLLRPGKIMRTDDPENPTILENLIKSIGGEAVISPYRNECCGGYITAVDGDAAVARSKLLMDDFEKRGAELIVTACPLCMYNLRRVGGKVPVVYFSELLASALGAKK